MELDELRHKTELLWKEVLSTRRLTNRAIAIRAGLAPSSLHAWEKDISKAKRDSLEKLYNFLSSFKQDLIDSKIRLEMVGNIKKELLDGNLIIPFKTVPYISILNRVAYHTNLSNDLSLDNLPKYPIIPEIEFKGQYIAFEAEGNSMNDGSSSSILDGDKLLCREIPREHWRAALHIKDWFFVLIHKTDGVLIKDIVSHDEKRDIILCHSLNPLFGNDFIVHLDDLSGLFHVVRIVDRQIRK